MITQISKESCTGCGICSQICKENAIKILHTFDGFSYPYADMDMCLMCGKCIEQCPSRMSFACDYNARMHYAFKSDDMVRWNWQGGAVFEAIARSFADNAIIYAPVFLDDYRSCIYDIVTEDNKHRVMLNSFIEYDITDSIPEISNLLQNGDTVIVFCVPCKAAAFMGYFKSAHENLIVIDTGCSGISSKYVWNQYLDTIDEYNSISQVKINSKELGCNNSIKINFFENSSLNYEEVTVGRWLTSFYNGLLIRSSCYDCKYINNNNSDMTLYVPLNPCEYDDGKGVTIISVNSTKGERIVKQIMKTAYSVEEIPTEIAEKLTTISISVNVNRKKFFEYCFTHGYRKAVDYIYRNEDMSKYNVNYALEYHSGDKIKWKLVNNANNIWRSISIDNYDYYISNGQKWNRIFLPLKYTLFKNTKYKLSMKLKLKTSNAFVRFLLADKIRSDATCAEIYRITNIKNDKWMIINTEFTVAADQYSNIMLSSTDFSGNDSYMCYDWIRIWEA